MVASDSAFTGAVPDIYASKLVPLLFEPYADDLAERVAAARPRAVMETAAGTGAVTRALATRLDAEAHITATDINQAMLDVAQTATPDDPRIEWRNADAMNLPFRDAAFDALACQFGVMFFPDRRMAYREAHRLLKPGGRFVFNAWDRIEENVFALAVMESLASRFPDDPPTFMRRVPHGYCQPDAIREDLAAAGFADVSIEIVAKSANAPSVGEVATGFCQGTPMRAEIEAREPDGLNDVTQAVVADLTRRFGAGPVSGGLKALVVSAVR